MTTALNFLFRHLPDLLIGFPDQRPGGLLLSLLLACVSIGVGFVIGLFIGGAASSASPLLRFLSRIYIETFRGIPIILLVVLIYQVVGLPDIGWDLSPLQAAIVSLTLYSGAYQAEILRAGLQSVPQEIEESARVLGGSTWRIYISIKLRYAVQVMLPAFVGQAISLFKDTSVVIVIGVAELMTNARALLGSSLQNQTYWVWVYLFVGFLYFVFASVLSRLAHLWEIKYRSSELIHSLASY